MKYDRQKVDVASLQEGDTFELLRRPDTVCRVTYHRLRKDDDGQEIGVIGYDIVEGALHWPVLYLPPNYQITLLLPTTTYVKLSGKSFVDNLVEQHGVKE